MTEGSEKVGPLFVCWSRLPRQRRVKCVVCKRRYSTLLCDGKAEGPANVRWVDGVAYEVLAPVTCDAPLCERCSIRPEAGVLPLPDWRGEGHMSLMHALHTERRMQKMERTQGPRTRLRDDLPLPPPKPAHVDVPEDTLDFCPTCAAKL